LTVRETEAWVKRLQSESSGKPAATNTRDPNIRKLESDLSDKLGAKVQFQHGTGGKGKLVINYNSLDELDGILGHIQ